jgi:hypothetical protein
MKSVPSPFPNKHFAGVLLQHLPNATTYTLRENGSCYAEHSTLPILGELDWRQ